MEQCLSFVSVPSFWRALELVLYTPWYLFVATWVLSFLFYDSTLFVYNVIFNYLVYALLNHVAHAAALVSPIAIPCDRFFYNIYRHMFPSPSVVTTLSYFSFFVYYHWSRRGDWWLQLHRLPSNASVGARLKRPRHLLRRLLLLITILVPPLLWLVVLYAYEIQSLGFIVANVVLAECIFVLGILVLQNREETSKIFQRVVRDFV